MRRLVLISARQALAAVLTAATLLLGIATPSAHALKIRHVELAGEDAKPFAIAVASDGTVWFTERRASAVGRITPSGTVAEFPTPTRDAAPSYITSGPDGNVWFTETAASKIARITPAGEISEFPTAGDDIEPVGIALGPDGNLWYTGRDRIGRMTTDGRATEFPVGADPPGRPWDITGAGDGTLWFTLRAEHSLRRITTSGEISAAVALAPAAAPEGLAIAADGAVWTTATGIDRIARATLDGIQQFPTPTERSEPTGIVRGPFGEMWVTERGADQLARVTASGVIEEFGLSRKSAPTDIALGPNNTLWFTEQDANRIGRVRISSPPLPEANLPRPAFGKVVNVGPVRGTIRVAPPPDDDRTPKPRDYRPLRAPEQIRTGSYIDARKGTVRILAAQDTRGNIGIAEARGALFKIAQSSADPAAPTELVLAGGDFGRCRTRKGDAAAGAAKKKSRRKKLSRRAIRKINVSTRRSKGGSFKTIGRRGSAKADGTAWEMIDRCGGTDVRRKTGVVVFVSRVAAPVTVVRGGRRVKTVRHRIVLGKQVRLRRLFGRGRGKFRTRGRFNSATVTG